MNAQELSRRLADSAATVVAHLLPGGKKQGREWKIGNVSGDAGDSLSVCIGGAKAGVWSDFSAGIGGDLLDLWMAARRCDLPDAMREAKAFLGVRDDAPLKPPKREPYKRPAKPQCHTPRSRVREWLVGRGLTEETITAFRIGEQERGDKVYAIFPYLRDGELVNTKSRNPDEKKDMLQAAGAEPCLFGWHLLDPNARMVAIFEGEIDAMTGHQVGIPSLSVNAGAGNHQWIESDWERLQQFSDIVLCYDNDDAGRKGAREVATRLGLERCRIATFGQAKDANEYLTDHQASGEDFEHCIKQARGLDPEELQQLADYMPATQAMFWPAHDAPAFPRLSFCGRAMDWWEWLPARVSVWTGINGHGKSLMLNQVLIPVMQSDIPVCMFSGELTPAQQLKRLSKQLTGIDRPTPAYLSAVQNWLQGRMWIFNVVGIAGLDRLLEVFAYAASRYGCGHFVIDSLMMLDVPEDGPGSMTAQKTAMRKIVSFAHATQSHVHLVAHPRKANDEAKAPGKLDVAGSGHITNGADNVFSVWSAQKPPGEDTDTPDARLEILKDRDDVGRRRVSLYFNRSTGQYTLDDARRSYQYVSFSQETGR